VPQVVCRCFTCCHSVATALSIENGLADSLSARPFFLFRKGCLFLVF
jgi:hypothetical protein